MTFFQDMQVRRLTPVLLTLLLGFFFVGISIPGQSQEREQTEFAAGEPIHVPVQIPAIAVRTLSADGIVSSCLKSKAIPPEKLSPEWFTASNIYLHRANETDLVVMPAMESRGSDKSKSGCWDLEKYKGTDRYEGTIFWILRNTGRGYEIALSEDVVSKLTIRATRSRGFRTVDVLYIAIDSVGADYMEFNGNRYVSKKYKLPE